MGAIWTRPAAISLSGQERRIPGGAIADMRAHRFRDSRMIDRVAFDEEAHTLCVSFKQTGKYVYYEVPASIFDAMCKAKSAGRYFNEFVKGKFRCRRDPERRRFGPSA